ncbi:hypothetical protein G7Y89_g3931 [Cudoniella acicularis]|uniref:Uncharacterized protein n=1 Tax=Cudoniella acicularis TaxID=354080 RepID=A0A8H4RRN2_9HELO|nr:hypothetical protein G7Y89_g3931 [Cudoniella acicularis]
MSSPNSMAMTWYEYSIMNKNPWEIHNTTDSHSGISSNSPVSDDDTGSVTHSSIDSHSPTSSSAASVNWAWQVHNELTEYPFPVMSTPTPTSPSLPLYHRHWAEPIPLSINAYPLEFMFYDGNSATDPQPIWKAPGVRTPPGFVIYKCPECEIGELNLPQNRVFDVRAYEWRLEQDEKDRQRRVREEEKDKQRRERWRKERELREEQERQWGNWLETEMAVLHLKHPNIPSIPSGRET